ncbi:MAG TPA: hypothetical protein VNO32_53445 [Candidatus Acidoferrum sp.]|nr:hypothetical protein [Candidatus Acidoferrum sp.]
MQPFWKPLEEKLGKERCGGFMYMGRINGINLYKHGMARTYLNLDDSGQCYVKTDAQYRKAEFAVELAKLEAALADIDETLASIYDDAYKARKDAALREAGVSIRRIEIEPEDLSIH